MQATARRNIIILYFFRAALPALHAPSEDRRSFMPPPPQQCAPRPFPPQAVPGSPWHPPHHTHIHIHSHTHTPIWPPYRTTRWRRILIFVPPFTTDYDIKTLPTGGRIGLRDWTRYAKKYHYYTYNIIVRTIIQFIIICTIWYIVKVPIAASIEFRSFEMTRQEREKKWK